MTVVVDSSAVLALARGERFSVDPELVYGANISNVNLVEVLTKLGELGYPSAQAEETWQTLGLQPIAFELEHARVAAGLHGRTKDFGLSLGDRACLALALILDCPAVTADRIWAKLDVGVDVVLIR